MHIEEGRPSWAAFFMPSWHFAAGKLPDALGSFYDPLGPPGRGKVICIQI